MKTTSAIKSLVALTGLLISSISFAGIDVEVDDNSVILAGYDAVAYFTQNEAVEGSAKFTAVHNDAIYYFSSKKNRNTFNDNPEQYAPQFGGFCSYGTSLGKKLAVNGKAFEIIDGKLYVNKSEGVHETWSEDKEANIVKANAYWPNIKDIAAKDL